MKNKNNQQGFPRENIRLCIWLSQNISIQKMMHHY